MVRREQLELEEILLGIKKGDKLSMDEIELLSSLLNEKQSSAFAVKSEVITPSTIDYKDLVLNALATYEDKRSYLRSLDDVKLFIQYQISRVSREIKEPTLQLKSDSSIVYNLLLINKAMHSEDINEKLVLYTIALERTKHSYKSYAKYLESDAFPKSDYKDVILDLDKLL